jgi:mono/diheme cytochrome c family protein
MRKAAVLAAVLILAVAFSGLAAGKGDAAKGKAVYAKRCGTCHGSEGEPKEAISKMMKVTIPHIGSKEVQAKSDDDLKKIITAGQGKMKAVTGLSDADLADVIAFMRTLAKK